MQRALIIGISGFVGPYLKSELEKNGYKVFGLDRNRKCHSERSEESDAKRHPEHSRGISRECETPLFHCDLLDKNSVCQVINKIKPDFVFHLAGFSSVCESWKKPDLCQKINVQGTQNLLEAILRAKINPKILIVSSAEVYGNPKELPLKETSPLNPENPYAKSRVAQEKLVQSYKNLNWIIARSFNHTGPGQPPIFVIPEFAKQLAEIKKNLNGDPPIKLRSVIPSEGQLSWPKSRNLSRMRGEISDKLRDSSLHSVPLRMTQQKEAQKNSRHIIKVGNLEAKRDFSDVRDVVAGYRLLLEKGKKYEIYNVCSGNVYKVEDLLNTMISQIGMAVKIEVDKSKLRPQDIQELRGDNTKIKKLGFKNNISIDKTLNDSLDWWIKNLSATSKKH
ncbi:MAG: GDP-mannose 4,6-dehydratase [Patescibacteria group bacterium]